MSLTFDTAIVELIRLVSEAPGVEEQVKSACAVRDLKGALRLALEPAADATDAEQWAQDLGRTLHAELGPWFLEENLLLTTQKGAMGRIAQQVLAKARQDPNAAKHPAITGALADGWYVIERHLGKQSWLEAPPEPPWDLGSGPPVVTFYSFKGGVGRTTTLALLAWLLARDGKRVLVVDLDLEAPGLSTLLRAPVRRGVLDFVVDRIATGKSDLTDLIATPDGLPAAAARLIRVAPAGVLNRAYLEKLARLDFVGAVGASGGPSPVGGALREFLLKAKNQEKPDYVFLDARSGLHDVSGLSLHGMSHLDLLFVRDSAQDLEGLKLTLAARAQEQKQQGVRRLVVHGMGPFPGPNGASELARVQTGAFEAFRQAELIQPPLPPIDAPDALHSPMVVARREELRAPLLDALERTLPSWSDLSELRDKLVELTKL